MQIGGGSLSSPIKSHRSRDGNLAMWNDVSHQDTCSARRKLPRATQHFKRYGRTRFGVSDIGCACQLCLSVETGLS